VFDILRALDDHRRLFGELDGLLPAVEDIARDMVRSLDAGGTVFWFGNGGSAAQAQHLAAELVGRYVRDRPALASVALNADTALLTAVANDYGFDEVFARQLRGLCREGDVAVGISTSGASRNVLRGVEAARTAGAVTVALTGGDGGPLAPAAHRALVVPDKDTARVQEAHLFLGHLMCEVVESEARAARGG